MYGRTNAGVGGGGGILPGNIKIQPGIYRGPNYSGTDASLLTLPENNSVPIGNAYVVNDTTGYDLFPRLDLYVNSKNGSVIPSNTNNTWEFSYRPDLRFSDVCYNENLRIWVGVGYNGIFTSTDKRNWTQKLSYAGNAIATNSPEDNNVAFISGHQGVVYTSTDSETWTLRTLPGSGGAVRNVLCLHDNYGDYYLAINSLSQTSGQVQRSLNLTSWATIGTGNLVLSSSNRPSVRGFGGEGLLGSTLGRYYSITSSGVTQITLQGNAGTRYNIEAIGRNAGRILLYEDLYGYFYRQNPFGDSWNPFRPSDAGFAEIPRQVIICGGQNKWIMSTFETSPSRRFRIFAAHVDSERIWEEFSIDYPADAPSIDEITSIAYGDGSFICVCNTGVIGILESSNWLVVKNLAEIQNHV
jgi:hypothetical protein